MITFKNLKLVKEMIIQLVISWIIFISKNNIKIQQEITTYLGLWYYR